MSVKTPPPPKDRRRSERKQHVVEAWIISPTATRSSEKLEVKSVNISRHGVCFSLAQTIPEGSYYIIEVLMGEQKIVSEIHVVTCRTDNAGRFDVGAEFC
jgi:hypothetical protein